MSGVGTMNGSGSDTSKGRDLDTIFVECYVGNLRVIDLDVLIREFSLPKTGSKDSKVARCIRFYKNLQRPATRTRFVNAVKQLLSARGINVDIESFRATMMPVYAAEQNSSNNNSSNNNSSYAVGADRSNSTNMVTSVNPSNNSGAYYSTPSAHIFHRQPQSTITMYTGAVGNRTSGISVPPAPGIQPSLLVTLAELGGVAPPSPPRRHHFQPAPLTFSPTSHMTSPAFYSPLEQITAACRLSSVSVPVNNSFHGCLLVFRLPDEAVELLSTSPHELSENSGDNSPPSKFDHGSQYKLLLRFKATEPTTFEADARPENLFIKVNERLVYHPEHIHQTKKRTEKGILFRPIELTVDIHGVNILSLEEDNFLSISYSPDIPRDYDFTLWVGKKRSVRDLRMLLDERQPSLKMCKQRVVEMLRPLAASRPGNSDDDDDDVAVIDIPEVRLSLKCPVSKTRLVMPCRGQQCQHIQAFDGDTFLSMNERRPTWRCFVCDRIIWFEDLYCDSYVKHLACTYCDADELDLLLDDDALKQRNDGVTQSTDVLKIVPHSDAGTLGDNSTSGSHNSDAVTRNGSNAADDKLVNLNGAGAASFRYANKTASAPAKRKNVDVIEILSDDDDDDAGSERPASQILLSDGAATGPGAENSAYGNAADTGKRSSEAAELESVGLPNKRPHVFQQQRQSDWRRLTDTVSRVQPTSLLQLMNGCGSHGSDAARQRVEVKLEGVSTVSVQPPSTNVSPSRNRIVPGLTIATPASTTAASGAQLVQRNPEMIPNGGLASPLRRHSYAHREVSQNPSNNPSSLIEWFVSGTSNGLKPNQTPAPDHLLSTAATTSPTHSQRSGSFSHFGGTSVPVTYDVVSSSFVPLSTPSTVADNNNNNKNASSSERVKPAVYTRSNIAANAAAVDAGDRARVSAVDGLMNSTIQSRRLANAAARRGGITTASIAVSPSSVHQPLRAAATPVQAQLLSESLGSATDVTSIPSINNGNDWSALLSQALLSSLCNQMLTQQQQPQSAYPYAAYPNSGLQFGNSAPSVSHYQQQQQNQQQYADGLQFLRNLQTIFGLSSVNKPDTVPLPVTGTGIGEQENNSPEQQFYAAAAVTPTAVSMNNNNHSSESSLLVNQQQHLYGSGISAADDGEIISNGSVAPAAKYVTSSANFDSFTPSMARSDSASALLSNYLLSLMQPHQQQQQQQQPVVAEPTTPSSTVQLATSVSGPTNHH